jgi:hypothetical protein
MTMTNAERLKNRARVRAWKLAHPDKMREQRKRHALAHPDKTRDHNRTHKARLNGYAPPPREVDCPSPPIDDCCDYCGKVAPLFTDHNHTTGAFRGWACLSCNNRFRDGVVSALSDDVIASFNEMRAWIRSSDEYADELQRADDARRAYMSDGR